jgi:hypothetical protein
VDLDLWGTCVIMSLTLNTTTHRIQLARDLHRAITNTTKIEASARNTITPIEDTITTVAVVAGQTTITGISYEPGRIEVFFNNIQIASSSYFATTGSSITFLTPFPSNGTVTIIRLNVLFEPNPSDFYYTFLAKTDPWEDDEVPPSPLDTRQYESEIKRNIMAMKRVQPTDVSLMARRINWTSNTVYTPWSDVQNMETEDFYVLTAAMRVYKCLFVPKINNIFQPSTVEPQEIQPGPFATSDGYVWQLLYEVPVADRVKLLTDEYIPVKFFATSTIFDHNATVEEIVVLNGGTNYTVAPSVIIVGDGLGARAEVEVTGQEITAINILDGGIGYSHAKAILVGGNGFGAQLEVILKAADFPNKINQNVAAYASTMAGAINFVEVLTSGSNYDANTNISVEGDGVGAIFETVVAGGQLQAVNVIDSGRGYTFANLTVSGAGAGATVRAVIEPEGGHGSNIPAELFATTVGMSINIEDTLTDFFLDNDFRQMGLLKNPYTYYETENFTSLTGTTCYVVGVDSALLNDITVDDILTSELGGRFRVISKTATAMSLLPIIDQISADEQLINITNGLTRITINSLTIPEVTAKKGDILYIRNMPPVERTDGQTEQIKFFISF